MRWWLLAPDAGNGEGGANTEVGVCMGVFWDEGGAVAGTVGCLAVGTSPE